jgi:hypothetical protein
MNAITTTVNEVVAEVRKDHEKEIAEKNAYISALKAKLGEARGVLRDVAVHLDRTSSGLDGKLDITKSVERFLDSIKKV